MEFRTLGRSGLKVSRACLGAMNFGTSNQAPCNEAEAGRIIDAFLGAGANFIDTANIYTAGQSEEIVGRAVKGRREKAVIATKGRGPIGAGQNDMGLSRLYLTRALDESLKRLGVDYVDLYQVHFPDADTPIEETMDALAGFVRAGKARYIGCSNFTGSQIVEAQWAASRLNGVPFISLQPRYSLISRDIETDILPASGRQGLGTLVYSPLGGGILTGKYNPDEAPAADTRFGRNPNWTWGAVSERNFTIAEAVREVAAELGVTSTAVALAWVLARNNITCAIIGPRTKDQLEQNLAAFDLTLPPEAIKRLSEVSKPSSDTPRIPLPRPRAA
jgi:aryl-alcohol dehydrogenase-like predicted oxidoreductase